VNGHFGQTRADIKSLNHGAKPLGEVCEVSEWNSFCHS
jgi:hypothetical protein